MRLYLILAIVILSGIAYAQENPILCDGCIFDGNCIDIGAKRISKDNTEVYCDNSKKLEASKQLNEQCANDYECLSYKCQGLCIEPKSESQNNLFGSMALLGGGAFLLLILFLAIIAKSGIIKKLLEERRKKMDKDINKKPGATEDTSKNKQGFLARLGIKIKTKEKPANKPEKDEKVEFHAPKTKYVYKEKYDELEKKLRGIK
jgi:hypothetical protein